MEIVDRSWKWRTQTWALLALCLAAILVAIIFAFASATFRPTTPVKVGQSGIYKLWTAEDDSSLHQGLSGVEQIPAGGGLLMDFKYPDEHGIVMRDMLVPIDIVWLDQSKKVVYIVKNVAADTPVEKVFKPKDQARYVLELPAGSVVNSVIKVGDKAEFDLSRDVR